MNDRTINQINNLLFTTAEAQHCSQKRVGYHVYLSYFFNEFGELLYEEKRQKMVDAQIWRRWDLIVEEDEDSVMTPRQPKPYEIMQLAARRWRNLGVGTKKAWKNRAGRLNELPRTERSFSVVPASVWTPSMEANIKIALTQEWNAFVTNMRRATVLNEKKMTQFTEITYKYGRELVKVQNQ